ncbi:hypothetical protein Tco_1354460 [Tanacetum coccineum]
MSPAGQQQTDLSPISHTRNYQIAAIVDGAGLGHIVRVGASSSTRALSPQDARLRMYTVHDPPASMDQVLTWENVGAAPTTVGSLLVTESSMVTPRIVPQSGTEYR